MKHIKPEIRAEAAAWIARLHSSGASARETQAGLTRWLEANPDHQRAFEIANEAWDVGAAIPASAFPRVSEVAGASRYSRPFSRHGPHTWRLALAIGAMGALAIAALVTWLPGSGVVLKTGLGEQRVETLEDGTRIALNTQTQVKVIFGRVRREIHLLGGEALFEVAADPRRPFSVEVGGKTVLALGTSFVVRQADHVVMVALIDGRVTVSGTPEQPDAAAATLLPGQRLTFAQGHAALLDNPQINQLTAWRRGEVVLDKTPLGEAVLEMNRYGQSRLVLEDTSLKDLRLSGIFRAGDSLRFANALSATYGLSIKQNGRLIIIARTAGGPARQKETM